MRNPIYVTEFCHLIKRGVNAHDNRTHQQCWSLKNNCSLYSTFFYRLLTLLLFYKIGSAEIQTESLSQTLLFSYKHHEGAAPPPGRLKTPASHSKTSMNGQVKDVKAVVQPGQIPSPEARSSRNPDSAVATSHVRPSHVS